MKALCPCCGEKTISPFATYRNLPEILFPVDVDVWRSVARIDLPLYACANCSHVFQQNPDAKLTERIYRELYKFYPFNSIEAFAAPYRVPFETAFDLIIGNSQEERKLLEIGCSSPDAMKKFLDKGFHCTGVDPSSKTFHDERLKVIGEKYESVRLDEQFDVIVLRFVLEHVIDLDDFLDRLSGDLGKGGYVFVQVPNVHQWMAGGTLCVGAHEHIQYFSRDSLISLFRRFGYEVVYQNGQQMPSLIACFTRGGDRVQEEYESFQARLRASNESIDTLLRPFKTVCFYGAGLQLMWFLYASDFDHSSKAIYVVDDNEVVQGRFLPALGIPVSKLSADVVAKSDVIVLTLNSIYHERAIQRLKSMGCGEKKVLISGRTGWRMVDVSGAAAKGEHS